MRKQTALILSKIAKKEKLKYRQLKQYYNTLPMNRKIGLLNEGKKL